MPFSTLGAPHTTSTFSFPVSTRHSFNLSALGCFFSSITSATIKFLNAKLASLKDSTSKPIDVSFSEISIAFNSVSKCSLSQEKENFIS